MNQIQIACAQLRKTSSDTSKPVWVQVALEGTYKGYAGGELEFTLDKAIFDQVVANLRRDPHYKAGSDGYGQEPVIAWDFNHSSEQPSNAGSLPTQGAPAQGWVLDLEARDGPAGAELWALTQWLEPARTYIKEGRYNWASISIVFDAVDPISGENVGSLLTSIAATNTPFVPGLQKLAASRGAQGNPKMEKINLAQYPGRNVYEQAMAHVRSTAAGMAMGYDAAFKLAVKIVNDQGAANLVLSTSLEKLVERRTAEAARATAPEVPDLPPLDLRHASGRNRTEKALYQLGVEGRASFTGLAFEERCRLASIALRTRRVVE